VGEYDATTWQAIGITLTVVGLVLSFLAWRSRGAAAGLRGVAWSLIPLAAAMTGLLRVVFEVSESVSAWALRLVFSPVVWTGIVVGGISAALFVVSGVLRRRGGGRPSRAERKAQKQQPKAAAGGSSPAAVTSTGPTPARGQGSPAVQDDDMADIEAILKKHGIS
jgi:heme exporter protein D